MIHQVMVSIDAHLDRTCPPVHYTRFRPALCIGGFAARWFDGLVGVSVPWF